MPKLNQQFQTIRTEGALLPADILQRIASLKVEGIRPADYHLPEGFRITEAVTQSWDILKKHWKSFQEARQNLSDTDHGTALTNERWLLPLFKELEYGRLSTVPTLQIEDRTYPIERFYNHTPIHLIGCNLPLDRRTKGARGAATSSPHSMMQEFLNRSDTHLWGFLSNGRQLRIMRDSVALSRQAFIEFDLEGMIEGEVFGDFVLLWLLSHQSRVEAERPESCWLEQWSKLAREEGTRVLNNLRTGVTKAIEALGQGFIAHPQNHRLLSKLQESGSLTNDTFYRQLLRIVYRLLFLFVAEDRRLLHPLAADENACELYDHFYSTRRLREIAFKLRGSKHADLWHSLSLVFGALNQNEGCPELGLPGLGSFLWGNNCTEDLLGPGQVEHLFPSPLSSGEGQGETSSSRPVFISNDDLLTAIRALAYIEQDKVLRTVDYRNLGTEEFGSVYESLLELHPIIHVDAKTFSLNTAAGNERKTSGSYYTPDSLVQCLLDSALDPVVTERLKGKKGKDAEDAILSIKVCDPACGSGHFLIAASHRLARHLARTRTGESEPSPEDHQHALRDVIGHCLYGVDINPMAVELCKVSLWMDALDPGRPLSFLDHHIQCGNSLLGSTPALLAKGIPDDAFTAIEGDVKARVTELKKRNRLERERYVNKQSSLFDPPMKLGNMAAAFAKLNTAPDGTLSEISAMQHQYASLVSSSEYESTHLLGDMWCSAFIWKRDDSELGKMCPTERDLREVESHAKAGLLPHVRSNIESLRKQYRFFHWHLAFPDVFRLPGIGEKAENEQTGWSGGFDIVLGNPPWERVTLKEKEWFQTRHQKIAGASTGAEREKSIEALRTSDPVLFADFLEAKRTAGGEKLFLRDSGVFPLCGVGDVNTFAVFAEQGRRLMRERMGFVLPTGIVTTDTTQAFVATIVRQKQLVSIFDFDNRGGIFDSVQGNVRFCLITLRRSEQHTFTAAAQLKSASELEGPSRTYVSESEAVLRINPNTLTLPLFVHPRDAKIIHSIYSRMRCLDQDGATYPGKWAVRLKRMLHMGDDSHLFKTDTQLESLGFTRNGNSWINCDEKYIPLMEAKLAAQFDHRAGTFDGIAPDKRIGTHPATRDVSDQEHLDPELTAEPRYWVPATEVNQRIPGLRFLVGFRDAVSAVADSRSMVGTIVPAYGAGHTLLFMFPQTTRAMCFCIGWFNAFCTDYVFRMKASGAHASFFILRQLPIPGCDIADSSCRWDQQFDNIAWLLPRVLELSYTAWDLEPFAHECGCFGPPFRWDQERRFLLRAELDAAFFHLYGIDREDAGYILDTFPIVKRKDIDRTEVKNESGEVVQQGTYVTKDTILEIYDAMADSMSSGQPYQTRLNPPPADPRVAHPPRVAKKRLDQGRVVLDILLLLEAWKKPVSITALEPALILMRNDAARRVVSRQPLTNEQRQQLVGDARFVSGLERLYVAMVANGAIRPIGQNAFELAQPELLKMVSQEDRTRAAESVTAIMRYADEQTARDAVAELTNDTYEIAFS